MKKILFYSFILIFLATSSCKLKKTIASGPKEMKSKNLFKELKKSNLDYKWYSFKSNATVFFNGTTLGGSVDVRMKKDEVIWMSVKKFGFEVARALIRPDSAFAIDRFNGKYMAESFEYFKKKYDVPIEFDVMQDILAGNSIIKGQKPFFSNLKDETYTLETKGKDLNIIYKIDKEFNVSNSNFNTVDNQSIELDFSKYKIENGKEIPYLRKYSFPNSINPKYFLNLKIKDIKINKAQKLKFEIPKKYTKM